MKSRSEFSYLQHWQSGAEYFGWLYDVTRRFDPVLGMFLQICKLLQSDVGLGKVKTRTQRCEFGFMWGKKKKRKVTVFLCMAVGIFEDCTELKTKSDLLKIEPQSHAVHTNTCTPCTTLYFLPVGYVRTKRWLWTSKSNMNIEENEHVIYNYKINFESVKKWLNHMWEV